MELDYSRPGIIKISMKEYINNMLKEFPEKINTSHTTPAAEHLFKIRNDATKLTPSQAEIFHTTIAWNLFLCKWARPDIHLTVSFLCTRVKEPDTDDWKQMVQLLCYIYGTKDLTLILESDKTGIIKLYVDAEYAVHNDCKGHTGAALFMGKRDHNQ